MTYEALTLDIEGGVATITLNRPEALNALIKVKKNLSDDDPYAGIYDDVPDGLWRTLSDDDYEEPLF